MPGHDSDVTDQSCDAASGERAAREAKQEDLVARDIVVGEEGIGLADIVAEACTSASPDDLVGKAARTSNAGLVVGDLRDARGTGGAYGASETSDVRGRDEVVAGFGESAVGVLPGAWWIIISWENRGRLVA